MANFYGHAKSPPAYPVVIELDVFRRVLNRRKGADLYKWLRAGYVGQISMFPGAAVLEHE